MMLPAEKCPEKYGVPEAAEIVRAVFDVKIAKAWSVAALLVVLVALVPMFASSMATRNTMALNHAAQNQKNNKKRTERCRLLYSPAAGPASHRLARFSNAGGLAGGGRRDHAQVLCR